ncbi:hypothetical protein ACWET9_44030 [Streptomyces sp. NPDC004059]
MRSSPRTPTRPAPTATDRRLAGQRPWLGRINAQGHWEATIVGSRGCPYNCTFRGAAVSANPDVTIRVRPPENIIGELEQLHDEYGVTAFRFVDDLFFDAGRVIDEQTDAFTRHQIGDRYVWDATGRTNVLNRPTPAWTVSSATDCAKSPSVSNPAVTAFSPQWTSGSTRDEFNFCVGIQFGDVPLHVARPTLAMLTRGAASC